MGHSTNQVVVVTPNSHYMRERRVIYIFQRRMIYIGHTQISVLTILLKAIAYHSLEDYGQVQVGITVDFRGPYHNELNVDLRYYRLSSSLFFSTFKLNQSASHISMSKEKHLRRRIFVCRSDCRLNVNQL